jgi:hypothetical protein
MHSAQRKDIKDRFHEVRESLFELERTLVEKLNSNYDDFIARVKEQYSHAIQAHTSARKYLSLYDLNARVPCLPIQIRPIEVLNVGIVNERCSKRRKKTSSKEKVWKKNTRPTKVGCS